MPDTFTPTRSPSLAAAGPNRRRRHFGYTTTVAMLLVLAQYKTILPIFRDSLRDYLDISIGQFGLLFSVGPLVGVVSVLFGGVLVDRLGAVRVIRHSLRGTAVAFALAAVAGTSYALLMLAICLGALFAGPLYAAMQVYIARLFPRDKRRMLAMSLAIMSSGGIAMPLLAEGLLGLSGRWGFAAVLHGPFAVLAVTLFTSSFLYSSRNEKALAPPTQHATAGLVHWRQFVLPLPVAWLMMLGTLHGATDTTLHVWMPKFLTSTSFDHFPILPGLVLAAYSLAYLIARTLLAVVPEHVGRRTLMVLPGLLGGGLLIAGILSRNFWLTVAGYVAGAFIWSNGYPTILAMTARSSRQHFGTALAYKGVLSALFAAACIALVGALVEWLGEARMWLVMLIPACGFPLVGIGGAIWLTWFDRPLPSVEID